MPSVEQRFLSAQHSPIRSAIVLVAVSLIGCLNSSAAQQRHEPAAETGPNEAAKSLIVKAMTARQMGRLDVAIDFAQNASLVSKDNPAILSLLSKLQLENGDTESGLYFARQAATLSPDPQYARAYAEMLIENGDPVLASELMRKFLLQDPADVRARVLRAKARLALGQIDDVHADLAAIDERYAGSVEVLRDLVFIATEAKDDRGQAFAREWISQDPTTSEPRIATIKLLLALGQTDEAAAHLEDAIRLDPQNDQLTMMRAPASSLRPAPSDVDLPAEIRAILMQSPVDRERLVHYSETLTSRWRDGRASSSEIDALGSALLGSGAVALALDVLVPALQADVTSELRWALVAEGLRRRHLLDEASLTCSDGQLFFPGSVGLLLECSIIAFDKGEVDDAARFMQLARRYADESPPLNQLEAKLEITSAVLAADLGDADLAVTQLASAVRMSPDNSTVLGRAALVYAILGHDEDALRFARSAVEADPINDEALSVAGRIYLKAKLYQEAEAALSVAVIAQDSNAALFELIGDAASHLQSTDRSRTAYERALQLDPTNSVLRKKLDALSN